MDQMTLFNAVAKHRTTLINARLVFYWGPLQDYKLITSAGHVVAGFFTCPHGTCPLHLRLARILLRVRRHVPISPLREQVTLVRSVQPTTDLRWRVQSSH